VTLLMACFSCMDCKLCSLGLEVDQNRSFSVSYCTYYRNTSFSVSTFTSVNLRDGVGMGWDIYCGDVVGTGTVFTGSG